MRQDHIHQARHYWRNRLSGEIPRTSLPVQYPLSTAYEQADYVHVLPDDLANQLLAISKGKKLALFVALLAAFQAWLSKINGSQSDIALTIPAFPLASLDGQEPCGHMVMRSVIPPEGSFKEMLERSKTAVSEAYKYQDLEASDLLEILGLQSEEQLRTPLGFAMKGLHDGTDIARMCDGRHAAVLIAEAGQSRIDLTFCYNGRLYSEQAMKVYAKSFHYYLEQLVEIPDQSVREARLLPKEEALLMLERFNDTDAAYSRERTIPELAEEQVRLNPDRTAVICEGVSISYGELNARANRLAGLLIARGAGPGSYVAVVMDRSAEMIVAVLGILKSGAAYMPIEPSFPKARIETILTRLPISCVVTKSTLLRSFQELVWKIDAWRDIVYLDVASECPPPEPHEDGRISDYWNRIANEALDRTAAGGFISSYNGLPFSAQEVDEYRDRVVALAKPYLHRTASVLEIGCGSGLISFAVAPHVGRFVGLDPSSGMLRMNRERADELGVDNALWLEGFAMRMEEWDEASFDLIILASTSQFFPGYFYFEQVVRQAMRVLKPGGALLIADIMDLRRKEAFKQSLELYRQEHGLPPSSVGDSQQELYCDEAFFSDLEARIPDIALTEVLYRQTGFANELGFRYDVLLHKSNGLSRRERRSEEESIIRTRKRHWTLYHISEFPDANPLTALTSEHDAYVIFTSGTTGVPKGVVVRHRPVINLIEWVNRTFNVGEKDRLLFVTSLCFDLSVYDIFGMLASGGSIRIATEEELSDRIRLVEILRKEPVTFWDSAPAALQQLAALMEIDTETVHSEHLRLVFLSGDWIPLSLPNVLSKVCPHANVIALGGATEATVWSNYHPVQEVHADWVSIPYGKPIQNARYYILDEQLHPCPPFVPGDLYIGGECLASGYTDAALTEERFIPDPFGKEQESRMYRTGDLARWMPDGTMEFLGRRDHQVKIRGYRIELGEISAQLLKHPQVREALITDRTDSSGGKSLVAYYTASMAISDRELKEHLGRSLPAYMIPSFFVHLPVIPATANGKVDRGALPDPLNLLDMEAAYEAPSNREEECLARIWEEVLGIGRVGTTDDFYALGGDSLKAVQVIAKANEYQLAISLRDMLQHRTIRDIVRSAEWCAKEEAAAAGETKVANYNLHFEGHHEEIPYYYPCIMGVIYTKLRHEQRYPIPRSFLPAGGGLGMIVYGRPDSDDINQRLEIDDILDLPGFNLMNGLGLKGEPVVFASVQEGLDWCEERMRRGQLVIAAGTTYHLNYSRDYQMDEEEFARMILQREEAISARNEGGIHHSHMFLLVDHTTQGYTVYDSTYNFFGTIPENEVRRSFEGVRGLAFLKRYPVKYANAGLTAIDLSFERFHAAPIPALALEILDRIVDRFISDSPIEVSAEGYQVYTGTVSFRLFLELIADASLNDQAHERLVAHTLFWLKKWKYTYIFLRDFLEDAVRLLDIESLNHLLKFSEKSIQEMGDLHDRLFAAVETEQPANQMKAEVEAVFGSIGSGLVRIAEQQCEAFVRVQRERSLKGERIS